MVQFEKLFFQQNSTRLSDKKCYLNNSDWILIAASWLITQAIAYSIYGINNREESLTYISLAEDFINRTREFELRHLWYSGYIILLMALRIFRLPYESMYVIQLILSFISLTYFVRIVAFWTSSRLTLLIPGLLYSTCFIIQQWVTHLFTDAFFSFLLIISLYYLLHEYKTRGQKTIFWSLLVILPFFRPVGFLFIIVACVHWAITFPRKNLYNILIGLSYLIFLLVLIYRSLERNSGYYYPFNNLDAEIICGLPSKLLQYQVVPYTESTRTVEYFLNNPEMTARLFFHRFYKVFSLTRPFFSPGHNIIIAIACVAYYSSAFAGVFHVLAKRLKYQYFLLAGCLIFSVPSVVFCVEWHGRMSLPIMAFILLLSAIGFEKIVNRFKNSR